MYNNFSVSVFNGSCLLMIQSNVNGSNIFRTMEIISRYGWIEPLKVIRGTRLGSKW